MSFSDSYKKIINRFNREKKYRLSVFSMYPHFDWRVLLSVSFICLILITAAGFQIYNTILESSDYEIVDTDRLSRFIDKNKLDETLKRFEEKEEMFNSLFMDEGNFSTIEDSAEIEIDQN
jgi:hypothetical protein